MRNFPIIAGIAVVLLAASSFAGSDCKIAVHVLPHATTSCNRLPDVPSCMDGSHTYDGCDDIDAFPVVYDIYGVTGVAFGLTWPDDWGSCAFTPCGFDLIISGEIVNPGDSFSGTWHECQYMNSLVAGVGWLLPTSPGRICPSPYYEGRTGVTDCDFVEHDVSVVYCAAACGAEGDDPCGGGISLEKTWGSIKSMYR